MIRPIFSTSYDAILGIQEKAKEKLEVRLYPNPTRDVVNIRIENGLYEGVEVYSIQGLKIIDSPESTVDLTDQPSGVYFFRVKGSPETYKIIKQ